MFTGLIQEIGRVAAFAQMGREGFLEVACARVHAEARPGDSIAVDGACLTVEKLSDQGFSAYVGAETLARTTLGGLRPGTAVNLEAALRASDRLGGHLVQGHVEGVGRVAAVERLGRGAALSVLLPEDLVPFVIPKGSIALDGVSLTVADLSGGRVNLALVPSTLENTTAGSWSAGRKVNVETDLVGRYIVSYLKGLGATPALTVEDLVKRGF
jgi:riboflavin synthase